MADPNEIEALKASMRGALSTAASLEPWKQKVEGFDPHDGIAPDDLGFSSILMDGQGDRLVGDGDHPPEEPGDGRGCAGLCGSGCAEPGLTRMALSADGHAWNERRRTGSETDREGEVV